VTNTGKPAQIRNTCFHKKTRLHFFFPSQVYEWVPVNPDQRKCWVNAAMEQCPFQEGVVALLVETEGITDRDNLGVLFKKLSTVLDTCQKIAQNNISNFTQ